MTNGDETRQTPRPSVFDDRSAEETQVVQNPYPPAHRSDRRPPVQPPGGGGGYNPPAEPPRYGAPPPTPARRPGGDNLGGGGDGLFGDGAGGAQPPQGGPNILANQAFDWEGNLQEVDVVRGSRVGLIALFVLALIAVVVVAIGLAAWSVLRGGGDDDATEAGGDTSTSTTDVTTSEVPVETTDTTIGPNQLRVTVVEDPFICDGGTREFALIGGAEPNESVAFTSPQAEGLRSGQADASGELPIRWQCDPAQAGTTWELTATGEISGKSATFIFAGVASAGQPAPTELVVDIIEDPFVCDGDTRVFGGLTGAEPNEAVAFSSPQSPGLRPGQADETGALPIRWQCDPAQVGTTWEITATGETSGRSVTFTVTGS